MKDKTNTDPMDEAYKMLDGQPSATGVSDAAKGLAPKNDDEDFRENEEEKNDKLYGETEGEDPKEESQDKKQMCHDIDEAYAMLFESLSVIMRNK